ncbi:Protein of unknown function [Pseudomonas linyingensis]|uniref:Thymidine phosphorylase n=1 Tax=Pseudomonas linyingensis TaxID=915471 RepID=A0A1H6YBT5_9PSED|nr:DUF1631 domain-containing protein [Pseudomonas linyingensis]SEJ34235.1 Protein of unknown function [Pseudomonas linyingensis]
MPTGLQPLREQSREFLKQGLQSVFDALDDSLFELGERAASGAAQQELFEAMRALRLKREGIEKAVLAGLDKAFGEMGAAQRHAAMDVLPTGLLTLVSHDELEETVAIKTMVMRSLSENGAELNPLQQRLQALVGSPVIEDNNPLSARTLCNLMVGALRPLELKIHVRLLLLKLFEKHLLKGVGELYAAANDSLIAAGVLPNLQLHTPRPARAAARAQVAAPAAVDSGAAKTPTLEPQAVLGQLRELLGNARGSASAAVAPADAVPVTQNDLTRLLSFLQRQPVAAAGTPDLRRQLDTLLARASANSPRPRVIGRLDEDVITLVTMLFEQVLGDDALPEPLRGPIGNMQVPLLKAAILDQRLFGEQAHPARQLLNEVTVAARDSEDLADMQRERLRSKIEQVSQRLRDEFTDDPQVFASLLEDFSRFNASEHKRAALLEQRLLEAEEARALREHARQQIESLLSERLQGLTLPTAIVQGLERGWGRLLQLILLREGDESAAWNQALATLDELLLRVAPLRSAEEARLLLGSHRQELLSELRRGLEQVAYDPFEQQRFFEELSQWQRKLLSDFRAGVAVAPAPEAPQAVETVSAPQVAAEVDVDPLAVEAEQPAQTVDPGPVDVMPDIPVLVVGEPLSADHQTAAQPSVVEPSQFSGWESAVAVAVEVPAAVVVEDAGVESVAATEVLASAEAQGAPIVCEEHLALVDNLGVGSWVELYAEDGAKQRCKLAAFIRVSGQFIFVNRAGAKVASFDREALALVFASGAARLRDNAQPFDRALEAIIGNLREQRGK